MDPPSHLRYKRMSCHIESHVISQFPEENMSKRRRNVPRKREESNHNEDDPNVSQHIFHQNFDSSEAFLGQFFEQIEAIKVKNLSNVPMPDSIKEFLSLGPKFCPKPFDIDRAQMEKDLQVWFRRLRA